MTRDQNIKRLISRLEELSEKQQLFNREIAGLREELDRLQNPGDQLHSATKSINEPAEIKGSGAVPAYKDYKTPVKTSISASRSNLERFIGENLINKIGIVITVIGVAIGARYAIEHQLVSPLTRIISGYLAGLALLGFALRLRRDYTNFSAVLLSGSMAIMYFITYAAYSFYGLFSQLPAFALMLLLTVFTVAAAIRYNRSVIAHIGLVGAYAVPFLLSEGSGKVGVLFSYMAIINTGILVISFRKYWKSLYIASFAMTSLIFLGWYFFSYAPEQHFSLALIILIINFLIFYLTFLAYKLSREKTFDAPDIILLLSNSFIFFGTGYAVLLGHAAGKHMVGLFTLANACIHFAVSLLIYRQKSSDRNLFYLVTGLALLFVTITIPVQLSDRWVTFLWAGEAALLFWIGRTKQASFYENLSGILVCLAMISLLIDWNWMYSDQFGHYTDATPLFNTRFLISLMFILALSFMTYIHLQTPAVTNRNRLIGYLIPSVLLSASYFSGLLELNAYWNAETSRSLINSDAGFQFTDPDINYFRDIWAINYSLLFFSVLSIINIRSFKNKLLGNISLLCMALAIAVFLSLGLYLLGSLRESYLAQSLAEYYTRGAGHLLIRYISLAFLALALLACYRLTRSLVNENRFKTVFELALHFSILCIASAELINWLELSHADGSYKFGLSILWGAYALFLIVTGIREKKKHLRIAAIILFGITLGKLFLVDITHLKTIAKTVVFIALGILLLIISFLYNKYKHLIFGDDE